MLHRTAQERYGKLKRVFHRLMENFTRDDLDDYIQTANSLREWIGKDPAMIHEQRAHMQRLMVRESTDWQIVNQIANFQKHVTRRPRSKKTIRAVPEVKVSSTQGAQAGIYVKEMNRTFGAGENIMLQLDGQNKSALGFVVRSFMHFHYIFELAPIPVDRRKIPALMDILSRK